MSKIRFLRIAVAMWSFAAMLGSAAVASAQIPLSEITRNYPEITADDRVLGNADAPITIFEYASLTCPHCAAFNADTMPKVKSEWIDTGKAKLIYRDFPLDRLALNAALVARCVPKERFFDFVDSLFKDQTNWAEMKETAKSLERVGELSGLSKEQVDACISDAKLSDFVTGERLVAATKYGVKATPTFFINGKMVVGEVSYAEFDKALRAASKP